MKWHICVINFQWTLHVWTPAKHPVVMHQTRAVRGLACSLFFMIILFFFYTGWFHTNTQSGLPCVRDIDAGRDNFALLLQQAHWAGVGVPASPPAVHHRALLLRRLWTVGEALHLMAVRGSVAGDLPAKEREAKTSWLAAGNDLHNPVTLLLERKCAPRDS